MKHLLYFSLAILFSACVRIPAAPPMANEVEYYKQMYGQAAASAAAANALTWAALALVVAVVTIIIAVQYFFNIRLNTVRLDAIKKDMQNQIEAQQNKLDAYKNIVDKLLADNQQLSEDKIKAIAKNVDDYRRWDRARYAFDAGQYESALFDFMKITKTRITDNEFDSDIAHQVTTYIWNITQLSESYALELNRILATIRKQGHEAADILEAELKKKNILLSQGRGIVKYEDFVATLPNPA